MSFTLLIEQANILDMSKFFALGSCIHMIVHMFFLIPASIAVLVERKCERTPLPTGTPFIVKSKKHLSKVIVLERPNVGFHPDTDERELPR